MLQDKLVSVFSYTHVLREQDVHKRWLFGRQGNDVHVWYMHSERQMFPDT